MKSSYKKLDDLISNISYSDSHSFKTNLHSFVNFCEIDSMVSAITFELKNSDIDVNEWWENALNTGGDMIGSCKWILPDDNIKRNALLYKFCIAVDKNDIDYQDLGLCFFGSLNFNEQVDIFYKNIIIPLSQFIDSKIMEKYPELDSDNSVYHFYDNSHDNLNINSSNIHANDGNINITHTRGNDSIFSKIAKYLTPLKTFISSLFGK